ncbi:MAG TPA: enolase C-terminal domain-like protein [Xanthobacteraceae bacterium]|nr:enolase C-terminal domain-like protein [Xanthobacteraceae bacterium]
MKIKTIEAIAVRLPMKKAVQMAGETVAQAENVFVRVESDAGAVGWGEAAAAPTMTGETIAGMMAAIELMRPKLFGRAAYDFAGAAAAMDAQLYGNSGAKAAIDMALHDLVGRASERPVYALFGAKQRSRMPVLAVIGSEDAAADLREAQARWNAGYRAFKIKVGLGSPEADAVRTMMLCQALKGQALEGQALEGQAQGGAPCLVSADANQGFSVDGALTFVRGIGDCGLDFFEQPVSAHDLDGMSRIAAATKVPIGADEGIHSLDDIARHHERKAARGVSLKAIKLGGLSGLFAASRLCGQLGMQVNISCKTGETSLASAAAVHLAAVAPALAWGLTVTSSGLAEDVTAAPLRVDAGHVEVPERPGLGIDVDEHRLRRRQQEFKRVA